MLTDQDVKKSRYSLRFITINTGGDLSSVDFSEFQLERLDEPIDTQFTPRWFHAYKSLVQWRIVTFAEDRRAQVEVWDFYRDSKSTLLEIDERPQNEIMSIYGRTCSKCYRFIPEDRLSEKYTKKADPFKLYYMYVQTYPPQFDLNTSRDSFRRGFHSPPV